MALEYLPYLQAVWNFCMVFCLSASIPPLAMLLYRAHRRQLNNGAEGLSLSMRIFVWTHFLNCLVSWPNAQLLVPILEVKGLERAYWFVLRALPQNAYSDSSDCINAAVWCSPIGLYCVLEKTQQTKKVYRKCLF